MKPSSPDSSMYATNPCAMSSDKQDRDQSKGEDAPDPEEVLRRMLNQPPKKKKSQKKKPAK